MKQYEDNITLSRAVDEDEEEETCCLSTLNWKPAELFDKHLSSFGKKCIVIAVGSLSTSVMRCYHEEYMIELGKIVEVKDTKDMVVGSISTLKENNESGLLLCQFPLYIMPDLLWEVTSMVFESLNVNSSDNCETVILDSLSVYEYQHNLVTINPPFIQSMFNSNHHHDKLEFSTMPQPNMIKGLSAAVLSYCELKRIEASLHVCVTDTFQVDVQTLNTYNKLLSSKLFHNIGRDENEVLKHFESLQIASDSRQSLYI